MLRVFAKVSQREFGRGCDLGTVLAGDEPDKQGGAQAGDRIAGEGGWPEPKIQENSVLDNGACEQEAEPVPGGNKNRTYSEINFS